MPSSNTRVEYTNSRNSQVNIVYNKRGSQRNGTQGYQKSDFAKGALCCVYQKSFYFWSVMIFTIGNTGLDMHCFSEPCVFVNNVY